MASVRPNPEQMQAIVDLGTLLEWAGMDNTDAEEEAAPAAGNEEAAWASVSNQFSSQEPSQS